MSICFFLFFLRFDGPPLFFKLFDGPFFSTGKNVGVAADHLFIDVLEDVPQGKCAVFFVDFSHEDHQKKHVAKFLAEIIGIIVVDGGDNLGELFHKIFFQAEDGLLLIPGATVRAKQGTYRMQEEREVVLFGWHDLVFSGGGVVETIWNMSDLRASPLAFSRGEPCFFLLEQAEVVAVDLADKLMGFLVGGVLALFQFFDILPGIPGREHKGELTVEFIIVLGDQITGEQDIDGRIIEILFAQIAQSGAADIVKIDGALGEFNARFYPGAGDDLAQTDGVLAGDGPRVGIGFRQDQGTDEIRADLVSWLKKSESGEIFNESLVLADFIETFAGEVDVLVFVDRTGELAVSGCGRE